MPRISTFMYCTEAKPGGQDQLQIINPLNVFRPAFVPGMFSFSVVFGILGLDMSGREYKLRIKFLSPHEGEEAIIDTGDIVLKNDSGTPVDPLPEEERGLMANLDFRNAILRSEGRYRTELYLENELLGVFPIYVKGGEE